MNSDNNDLIIIKPWFIATFLVVFLEMLLFSLQAISQLDSQQDEINLIEIPDIKYTAEGYRNPFQSQLPVPEEEAKPVNGGVGQEPVLEIPKPKPSEVFRFSIQGIIWNPENPMAIINNQVFKKGDEISMKSTMGVGVSAEKVKIKNIEKDGVTLDYSGVEEKLPSPAVSDSQILKGGK